MMKRLLKTSFGVFLALLWIGFVVLTHFQTEESYVYDKISGEALKVIIVASMPRSGSTYLQDLLTAQDLKPSSFFEPVRWLDKVNNGLNEKNIETKKVQMIKDFLGCNFGQYEAMVESNDVRSIVFKRPKNWLGMQKVSNHDLQRVLKVLTKTCRQSNIRVLKTIRTSLSTLLKDPHLLADDNFKVILIQRDPRASIHSMSKMPMDFLAKNLDNIDKNDPATACQLILNDLKTLEDAKLSEKVHFVKYEELVEDKLGQLQEIFTFLGIPQYRGTAFTLTEPPLSQDAPLWKFYYGTHRNKSFKHDKWKSEIKPELLSKIENTQDCQKVFRMLGYSSL